MLDITPPSLDEFSRARAISPLRAWIRELQNGIPTRIPHELSEGTKTVSRAHQMAAREKIKLSVLTREDGIWVLRNP
jgi:hypothetical protein